MENIESLNVILLLLLRICRINSFNFQKSSNKLFCLCSFVIFKFYYQEVFK